MNKVRLSRLKADSKIWVINTPNGLFPISSITHFIIPKHNQPGAIFKPLGLHGPIYSTDESYVELDFELGKDTYDIELKYNGAPKN